MFGHNKATKKWGGSVSTQCFCVYCDKTRDASHFTKETLCTDVCEEFHEQKGFFLSQSNVD